MRTIALFVLAACMACNSKEPPVASSQVPVPLQPLDDARVIEIFVSGHGVVRASSPAVDCAGACSAIVRKGATLTLAAEPADGHRFDGWDSACTGPASCVIKVESNAEVRATFVVANSGDCADLVVAAPSEPVVFQTDGTWCGPATSNGASTVSFQTGKDMGARVHFVDARGVLLNVTDTVSFPQVVGQLGSFAFVDSLDMNGWGWRYSILGAGGQRLRIVGSADGEWAGAFQNPLGGIHLSVASSQTGELRSYDDDGNLRVEIPASVSGCYAIDRTGNGLTLAMGPGWVTGRWISTDGQLGAPFIIADDLPASSGRGIALGTRVGGGFFLYASSFESDSAHLTWESWVRQIDSMAMTASPAPRWLTERSDRTIQMARGGRAYAVAPRPGQLQSSCRQSLEIVAPSGKVCSVLHLDVADGPCTTAPITVGYDGTVIQQLPEEFQAAGTCTWRYWPGLVH